MASPALVPATLALTVVVLAGAFASPGGTAHFFGATVPPLDGPLGGAGVAIGHPTASVTVVSGVRGGLTSVPALVNPDGVAFDPASGDMYVANGGSDYVTVIDGETNKDVAAIPVGTFPTDIAFDSRNGEVYVENSGSANVTVIDPTTETVVASPAVGAAPGDAAIDPVNGDIFVPSAGGALTVIAGSNNTVIANLTAGEGYSMVGGGPPAPVFDPANGEVYVLGVEGYNAPCGCAEGEVTVVNGTTSVVTATVPVGLTATSLAVAPPDGDVYVTNAYSGTISIISAKTNAIVETLSGYDAPTYLMYDPFDSDLYVGEEGYTVEVLSTATEGVIGTIPVATGTAPMVLDGPLGLLDQTARGSPQTPATVTVISATTNSVITTVSAGLVNPGPRGLGFDLATGSLYVPNSGGFNVSVIGPFPVTIAPAGLAPGLHWSVRLVATDGENRTLNSTAQPVTFLVSNGTYTYTVTTPTLFSTPSSSGTVVVNGVATTVTIQYAWSNGVWALLIGGSVFVVIGGVVAIRWRGAGLSPLRREYARQFHQDMHRPPRPPPTQDPARKKD